MYLIYFSPYKLTKENPDTNKAAADKAINVFGLLVAKLLNLPSKDFTLKDFA